MPSTIPDLSTYLNIPGSSIRKKLKSKGIEVLNGSDISKEGVLLVAEAYCKPRGNRSKETVMAATKLVKELSGKDFGSEKVHEEKIIIRPASEPRRSDKYDKLRFPDKKTKPKSRKPGKSNLQQRLSADWLILTILIVILGADMFSFAVVGDYEFGDKFIHSWVFFAVMGLAVGLGSIVTYNRIEDNLTANAWKITFGILQFAIFESVINEWMVCAGVVMAIMFVLVFVGAQRSIKG